MFLIDGLRRAIRRVRNGLHPVSAVKLALGRHDDIRFHGARVEGPNRKLVAHTVLTVWAGEYDAPGFRPARGERVVDVGANVGAFGLLAAGRGALVEAYEPHPDTFGFLKRNAEAAGVSCHQAAVLAQEPPDGTTELWLHPTNSTQHSTIPDRLEDGSLPTGSVQVAAVSLADAVDGGCDLLKLDCEGAEFELLLETPEQALAGVRRLVTEYHDRAGDLSRLEQRLGELGYRVSVHPHESAAVGVIYATRD